MMAKKITDLLDGGIWNYVTKQANFISWIVVTLRRGWFTERQVPSTSASESPRVSCEIYFCTSLNKLNLLWRKHSQKHHDFASVVKQLRQFLLRQFFVLPGYPITLWLLLSYSHVGWETNNVMNKISSCPTWCNDITYILLICHSRRNLYFADGNSKSQDCCN